jgi:hypothetical protein
VAPAIATMLQQPRPQQPPPLPPPAMPYGMLSPQAPGNAIPESELRKFNFGAFCFSYLYTFWNAPVQDRIIAVLFNFIIGPLTLGIGSLAYNIYYGVAANRKAAAYRQFTSVEQFRAIQDAWRNWGVGVILASVVLWIFIFLFSAFGASTHS